MTAGTGEGQPSDERQGASPTPNDAAQLPAAPTLKMPPCDRCNASLDRRGYAIIDVGEAGRRAARTRAWREEGAAQGPCPPLVAWELVCGSCASGRDKRSTFAVRVDKLDTDRRLLRQTLRITAKPWAGQTGWAALVLRILGAQGGT
jgi:hypothetical protein